MKRAFCLPPRNRSTSATSSNSSATVMPGTCPIHSTVIPPSLLRSSLARGLFTGTLNPPPCRSSTGFTLRNSGELLAASRQARPCRFVRSRRCDRRPRAHGYGGFLLSAIRPRVARPETKEKEISSSRTETPSGSGSLSFLIACRRSRSNGVPRNCRIIRSDK